MCRVMAQQLKRWESPRRQGRNDKGKGGAARQRQLKKRQQMLRKKLTEASCDNQNESGEEEKLISSSFLWHEKITFTLI